MAMAMSDGRHTAAGAGAPFEFESHVRYSEVDHRGIITLPSIIDYFQDCSTFQSETLGLGIEHLHKRRRAWVLMHWHIIIERYPSLCEPIRVGTFASSFKGLVAHRNFYLGDRDGEHLVRADSVWALVDLDTGRPCRPKPADIEAYPVLDPLPLPSEGRKVLVPAELKPAEPVAVQRHHIDMNEHVNNCEYVRMALDLAQDEVRRVRVDYRRAATLGDTLHPFYAHEGGRTVVDLRSEDGSSYATVELS